jgi:hypothetical protein
MSSSPNILERAFDLARSGECTDVAQIRIRLKQERYESVEAHLRGPAITRQLRLLCEAARTSGPAA